MKLYKVTMRGGISLVSTNYHESYVVAPDPTSAYKKVRAFLDKEDLGFDNEREMDSVVLLADSSRYGDCGAMLFVV